MNAQTILTVVASLTTATLAVCFIRDLAITTYQAWKHAAPQTESATPTPQTAPLEPITEPTAPNPELLPDPWTTEAITANEPTTPTALATTTFKPELLLLPCAKVEEVTTPATPQPALQLNNELNDLTVVQLRKLGGQLGLMRLSRLPKHQLITLIDERQQQQNKLVKQLYSTAY